MHECMHTCMNTYIHSHIHTYNHTYINAYIQSYKKDQTDPLKYLSLHTEVKNSFQDFDFIYTDGSVSDNKPAAAAVIDN